MRRFIYLTVAALLGAGSYLIYHGFQGNSAPLVSAPERAGALDPGKEPVLPGPILSDDAEVPHPAPPAPGPSATVPGTEGKKKDEPPPAVPLPPAPDPPPERPVIPPPSSPAPPPDPPPEKPAAVPPVALAPAVVGPGNLEEMIRISRAAFAAGDSPRGVKLLREIFQSAKDRSDVDIVPQARQLLEVEERGAPGGPDLKLELCRYLDARDSDPAWRHRTSLALGTWEARVESPPEDMKAAWKHLSAAYLAAAGPAQRQKVMDVLKPFLDRNIFSRRFSPLVETYTVKAGDSLNRIARSRGTTEEAIQRLNQLKGTVIQPGQRLILIAGKPRLFVKKGEFRLWLMVDERLLLEYPVGLGRDNSTPASVFKIRDRQKDPIWYRRGDPPIPSGDPRNILGSRWLGFKNTDDLSGFGIHGTSDPSSIGKEASAGCIRMRNDDIEVLWDLVPQGTEVEIRE